MEDSKPMFSIRVNYNIKYSTKSNSFWSMKATRKQSCHAIRRLHSKELIDDVQSYSQDMQSA